ncbi:MAG TPA: 8-amino-7-oxononanoate synthase [Oscillatoriaceae cyanobacterium M33_DOE_052]|uniref:8-amino-7-ketopelargonate synthase n=1 Tax=Planktothricoides sp. SpSt-374 TaxID=2282167 RepID=A0A7C3ZPC9_9CYAN|nr:8-amino-7-oxononanoate synthase [Oscillatoriaceae cyanobacterium M33_DOE_052]
METNPYAWVERSLETIRRAGWYREPEIIEGSPGAVVLKDGRKMLNFASNDYLGLAGDPRLIEAATKAINTFGTGATGSRLLSGHRILHQELETAIAQLKQTEAALVFSSGYLANIGTISAIVGQRDLILADQYNHSSLKNGAILSLAHINEYLHNNIADVKKQLQEHRHQYRRCLIVTDSVFSMDGDICQLPELLELADKYNCMVLVDEAHATGVFGATGAGCVEHYGCTGKPLIQIGTLSKALGSLGGYVAGSKAIIDFLRNRAPSWIYTTGLSPGDAAAALAAVQIIQTEPERRAQLWKNVTHMKNNLKENLPSEFQLLPSASPIICVQVPSIDILLRVKAQLLAAGIFVAAVRPPTVPTSRLRLTVMATHTKADCEKLASRFIGL